MKTTSIKQTLTLALALLLAGSAAAQDRIVKRDATVIEANVLQISQQEIQYKRFSNPDGPTYLLPVAEIDYIQYPNGERDTFAPAAPEATPEVAPEAAAKPAEVTAAPAAPAAAPASAPDATADTSSPAGSEVQRRVFEPKPIDPYTPEPARRWQLLERYSDGQSDGIVVAVDETGEHGLIMSLDEVFLPWSTKRIVVGADDKRDGSANMAVVARAVAAGEAAWSDFPAFKWCRDKGEGWYMPAIDEIFEIGNFYNGGMRRTPIDRNARRKLNEKLKAYGGKALNPLMEYFSSTEFDAKEVRTTPMGVEPPFMKEQPKHSKFPVRAVRKF